MKILSRRSSLLDRFPFWNATISLLSTPPQATPSLHYPPQARLLRVLVPTFPRNILLFFVPVNYRGSLCRFSSTSPIRQIVSFPLPYYFFLSEKHPKKSLFSALWFLCLLFKRCSNKRVFSEFLTKQKKSLVIGVLFFCEADSLFSGYCSRFSGAPGLSPPVFFSGQHNRFLSFPSFPCFPFCSVLAAFR